MDSAAGLAPSILTTLSLIPALKYNINNLPHKPKFTSKPKIVFLHILFLITSNQNWMEAGKANFPNYRIKLQWPTEQRLSRKMLSKKNSDLARYVCTHRSLWAGGQPGRHCEFQASQTPSQNREKVEPQYYCLSRDTLSEIKFKLPRPFPSLYLILIRILLTVEDLNSHYHCLSREMLTKTKRKSP